MQTAKLKLPVKKFHQINKLLGEILDFESENCALNLDYVHTEIIEDFRYEIKMQIPEEKPTETTYAFTTAVDAHQVTPLKLYEVRRCTDHGGGFLIKNDRRSEVYCIENGCSHLSSDQSENWNLITVTNK